MSGTGFCVWLTGLSGSGKSTIAEELDRQLRRFGRAPTVFDGDAVRSQLSRDLGFTREDRNANVLRVAARAADVVKASGVAVCAMMSPYADAREHARQLVGADRFVLVHVATPLGTCEERDAKGLYARARRGEVHHFVGIDEPYEVPGTPDLRLDTSRSATDADVQTIVSVLIRRGLLSAADAPQHRRS
jgi:sulfate adenylyltransferase